MKGIVLSTTNEPLQTLRLALSPGGEPLQARIDLRYLRGIDRWVLSIWDEATGELLVNQIPLLASEKAPDDLLLPFRHLRQGKGLGSLYCLKAVDRPATAHPSGKNLTEFCVLFTDQSL